MNIDSSDISLRFGCKYRPTAVARVRDTARDCYKTLTNVTRACDTADDFDRLDFNTLLRILFSLLLNRDQSCLALFFHSWNNFNRENKIK